MKLISLLSLLLISPVFSYESRVLGDIEMRLGSTSSSDKNELLFEILTLTVGFLDEKLSRNFADYSSSVEFDKVSLSAMSYDITEVNDGFVASMTLTGRAFFTEGTSPAQQEVIDLTAQIFQEENQDYLASLMVSSNVFLQDTQYAIVQVDGNVVSENRGQEDNNTVSMDSWVVLLVGGITGFLVVLMICLLWYCCSYVSADEQDAVVRKTPSKATKNTAEEDESLNERSQTPSPVRSISSQDSSVFTYNPKSSKSVDSKTFGSFLTNTTGSEIDVEAWQKGSKVPKDNSIFGHDISAIENKKDLSLIEEGSDEENTPDKRRPGASYLTKYPQGNLQAARPSAGSQINSIRRSSSSSSSISSSSSRANKRRNIDLEADAEELINDLKDLSVQINRYRNG